MLTERDEALEDEQREYRYAQNAHNADSRPASPANGKIARYYKGMDQSSDLGGAYVFYIDRTTGERVLDYDAADPANTNPYYGARSDGEHLRAHGHDLKELIDPGQAVITEDELRALNKPRDDDWLDEDWEDDEDDY